MQVYNLEAFNVDIIVHLNGVNRLVKLAKELRRLVLLPCAVVSVIFTKSTTTFLGRRIPNTHMGHLIYSMCGLFYSLLRLVSSIVIPEIGYLCLK